MYFKYEQTNYKLQLIPALPYTARNCSFPKYATAVVEKLYNTYILAAR